MLVTPQILIKSGSLEIIMLTEENMIKQETERSNLVNSRMSSVRLETAITKLEVHFPMVIEIHNLNRHIER